MFIILYKNKSPTDTSCEVQYIGSECISYCTS